MKSFLHRLVPCTLFLVPCALCLVPFLSSCENDEKKVTALTKNVVMKEEAKEVESFLSQDGKMRARLKAPYMLRVFADTIYVEFPQTLHVDFYDQNNQVETILDSRYGKYFENLNKVYLRDSVIVISNKGDTLKSPDLWWDQSTKMFYTDKYAEYHTQDKNIYGGKGLEATQDLNSITFKYPTGTVRVSETGFPK
jgi:LPS export ABC transporter protein LptC